LDADVDAAWAPLAAPVIRAVVRTVATSICRVRCIKVGRATLPDITIVLPILPVKTDTVMIR
jgi:hypothetical protein